MANKIRVTFYIDEDEYLQLRSRLIIRKITVSSWLRERVRRYVEHHTRNDHEPTSNG
jgi:hypothetical protein